MNSTDNLDPTDPKYQCLVTVPGTNEFFGIPQPHKIAVLYMEYHHSKELQCLDPDAPPHTTEQKEHYWSLYSRYCSENLLITPEKIWIAHRPGEFGRDTLAVIPITKEKPNHAELVKTYQETKKMIMIADIFDVNNNYTYTIQAYWENDSLKAWDTIPHPPITGPNWGKLLSRQQKP